MQQALLYASLRQPGERLLGELLPFLMRPSRASNRAPTDLQVSQHAWQNTLLAVAPLLLKSSFLLLTITSPVSARSALLSSGKTRKEEQVEFPGGCVDSLRQCECV